MVDRGSISITCPARAALAGNPSDGFGGTVVAVPVRAVGATITVRPAERFELDVRANRTFADLAALREHVDRHGYGDGSTLLLAAIRRTAGHLGLDLPPCRISLSTSIPRSVGLAGSSAIVIATIRAMVRATGAPELPADELASLAWEVETEELGIPAGLQDRVVQAHDRPMLMRFGGDRRRTVGGLTAGTYEVIEPESPVGLLIAHRVDTAESSAVAHADLRRVGEADGPVFESIIADLALHAEHAATGLRTGDVEQLGAAMDGSFDARRQLVELRAAHVEMVEVARRAGAHANFSGSGGAITVLAPQTSTAVEVRAALHEIGCQIIGATVA